MAARLQHDDHCWLTWCGDAWKIRRLTRGGSLVFLARISPQDGLTVYSACDLTEVRWPAYVSAAVHALEAAHG